MKQIETLSLLALGLFTAELYAQQPVIDNGCSNATLTGSYGVIVTGTHPATSVLPSFPGALYPVGTTEALTAVAIQTFDGKGNYTQVGNTKGYLSGITFDLPGSGTYSVNPDCTGTYNVLIPGFNFPVIVVRFVIVDSGKEFRGVVVAPQTNMVIANGRKMN
jgi:hypothetical protein